MRAGQVTLHRRRVEAPIPVAGSSSAPAPPTPTRARRVLRKGLEPVPAGQHVVGGVFIQDAELPRHASMHLNICRRLSIVCALPLEGACFLIFGSEVSLSGEVGGWGETGSGFLLRFAGGFFSSISRSVRPDRRKGVGREVRGEAKRPVCRWVGSGHSATAETGRRLGNPSGKTGAGSA